MTGASAPTYNPVDGAGFLGESGQYTDWETRSDSIHAALACQGNRLYDPQTGRFITADVLQQYQEEANAPQYWLTSFTNWLRQAPPYASWATGIVVDLHDSWANWGYAVGDSKTSSVDKALAGINAIGQTVSAAF